MKWQWIATAAVAAVAFFFYYKHTHQTGLNKLSSTNISLPVNQHLSAGKGIDTSTISNVENAALRAAENSSTVQSIVNDGLDYFGGGLG